MPRTTAKHVLAGDVGGTKTHLGLFELAGARPTLVADTRYPTSADTSLETLVTTFLGQLRLPLRAAAFGVAGPVTNGRAQLTNHAWSIDAAHLTSRLGMPVRLVNDLEALAYALDALQPSDVSTVQPGRSETNGVAAVIGVGTGFGAACFARHATGGVAYPTESGHADFAPRTALEDQLVARLRRDFGRATVEHVVSGRGLVNLHRFTHDGTRCDAVASLDEHDWPSAVTAAGQDGRCRRCTDALGLFVSALGHEAGNFALRCLPTGGLYLGGGVSLALLPLIASAPFRNAFADKAPMHHLLADIPIHVVVAPTAGLLGAARVAARLVN